MGLIDKVDVVVNGAQDSSKALVEYNTVILKQNIRDSRNMLTQQMMSHMNTKYVIKWAYTLAENIVLPKNCLIEFDGGSIKNDKGNSYTLTGNDTILIYNQELEDVVKNVELEGTFIYKNSSGVADEEDITVSDGKLKFRDKPNTDGMGKIILRKNKTFAEQVTQENTIYEIRYEFAIDVETAIPNNCILKFIGGNLSGTGSIICSDTGFTGNPSINLICKGTIKNYTIQTSWFRDINCIQFNLSNHYLLFNNERDIKTTLLLKDAANVIVDGAFLHLFLSDDCSGLISVKGTSTNVEIKNFNVVGNENAFFASIGNYESHISNVSIHDCYITSIRLAISFDAHTYKQEHDAYINQIECYNNYINLNSAQSSVGFYGIHIANADYCNIHDNDITGCQRHAIYHAYGKHNKICNNNIHDNGYLSSTSFAKVLVARSSKDVLVANNIFSNNVGTDLVVQSNDFDSTVLIEKDVIAEDITITSNVFNVNRKLNPSENFAIQVGLHKHPTKNVSLCNNTIRIRKYQNTDNGLSCKRPLLLYWVKNLIITNNTIEFSVDEDSAVDKDYVDPNVIYVPSQAKIESSSFVFSNNIIKNNYKYKGSVFTFSDTFILSGETLKNIQNCICISNNKILGQRNGGLNYRLYSNNVQSIIELLPNFQKETYFKTYSSLFDKEKGIGEYAIVGDVVEDTTGRYICVESGDIGIWRLLSNKGTTEQRPKGIAANGILTSQDIGFKYFDQTKGQLLVAAYINPNNGNVIWYRYDGMPADIRTYGSTQYRPNDVYPGFMYYDSQIKKPVFWTGSEWIDATGATI